MRTEKGKSSKVLRILPGEKAESQPAGRGARQAVEHSKSHPDEVRSNLRAARSIWGPLPRLLLKNLREQRRSSRRKNLGGKWTAI